MANTRIYLFVFISLSVTPLESVHVCGLIRKTKASIGLSIPSNTGHQKHFLIIRKNSCQLEATYDRSERKQFGIKFGFKNDKQCRQIDWLSPTETNRQSLFQCGFGLRSFDENTSDRKPSLRVSNEWTHNRIGFVSIWTNRIHYSLFPVDTEDLTPTQDIKEMVFDMKKFIPTFAYNVYSKQDLSSIVFFEQKNYTNIFHLRAQVFKFNGSRYFNYTDIALEELVDYSSPDVNLRFRGQRPNPSDQNEGPNLRQWGRDNSQFIPKAVMKTDRSMKIVGLYGIALPRERSTHSNGTIILFKKDGPNGFQTYWYCVTPEYTLSEDCKSPENYKLFIDCDEETIPEDNVTTTEAEMSTTDEMTTEGEGNREEDSGNLEPIRTTNWTPIASGTLFWFIISILAIVVIFLVFILIVFTSDPYSDESNETFRRGTTVRPRPRRV